MKCSVITRNEVPAIHHWNEAENYLKYPHRHVFIIYCSFEVKGENREIEIIKRQSEIDNFLHQSYKSYDDGNLYFGTESCETVARKLFEHFNCDKVVVLEDGFSGASIEK